MLAYDQVLAALCLWREGRGSTVTAINGIWHVIQNRTTDTKKRWPRTISGVILEHAQFSSFSAGDPNAVKFPVEPATGLPGSLSSPDWKAFQDCMAVVQTVLAADSTNGANCYESLPPEATKPAWADPDKITVTIGPFRFYKL